MKTKNILLLGGLGLAGLYMLNRYKAQQAAAAAAAGASSSDGDGSLGEAKGWFSFIFGASKAMGEEFRNWWEWSETEAEEREVPESDADESEEEQSLWGDFVDFVTGE